MAAIYKDIVKLFQDSDKDLSITTILETLAKDAAVLFVDVLKGIFDVLITLVKDFVRIVKTVGNHTIDILIFSALHRAISGGYELTIFDAVCLMMAIPATFMHKLIVQKPLPKIDGYISKDVLAAYVGGAASADQNHDIGAVSAYGFLGVSLLGSLVGVLDWLTGDVGTMSSRVQSVVDRAESQNLRAVVPRQNLVMKQQQRLTQVHWLQVINVVCVYSNCVLTTPPSKTDPKWGPWSLGVMRAVVSTITIFKRPDTVTARRIVAGGNVLLVTAQFMTSAGLAIDKGKSDNRTVTRMLASSCSLISTLARSGAVLNKDDGFDDVCELVFVGASIAGVGFQIVNLIDCQKNGYPWEPQDPSPYRFCTYTEGKGEVIVLDDTATFHELSASRSGLPVIGDPYM